MTGTYIKEGKAMTRVILRDKTLEGLDRFFAGSGLELCCWAVIIVAVLYFGPVCIRILAR
jgi:hypothetical protein